MGKRLGVLLVNSILLFPMDPCSGHSFALITPKEALQPEVPFLKEGSKLGENDVKRYESSSGPALSSSTDRLKIRGENVDGNSFQRSQVAISME